jgi:putative hydrolase of the HAD superfamily
MTLNLNRNSIIIFDLDDTLYNEIDFLKSAFKEISKNMLPVIKCDVYEEMLNLYYNNRDVFDCIIAKYSLKINKSFFIQMYRNHFPIINLMDYVIDFLKSLKANSIILGIISDGRSIQQRNKINALNINLFFEHIIISEEVGFSKPDERIFKIIERYYPQAEYYYFGDNIKKDFIVPNKIGWKTLCLLDNGNNIHKQNLSLSKEYLPQAYFNSYRDIIINFNTD